MKRTLIVLCAAFTFGFVGYVGAQSGYGGEQPSTSKSKDHSKSSREVTLSGCLAQGASSNLFVLRNATEGTESGSASTGTSGSSSQNEQGTSGQSSMKDQQSAMDFQLVGKNLKKYVGQRIEVRGIVEPMKENGGQSGSMSSSGSMSGTEGSQGTTGSQSGSMSGGSMSGSQSDQTTAGAITHRVKVRSVKQLGSSCQ